MCKVDSCYFLIATMIEGSCHVLTFSDRIRDQETESWLTLLQSRDERMRRSMTEEELRDVHVHLVAKVKESMDDVKHMTVKQHMEQQQHMAQQQSTQAIST